MTNSFKKDDNRKKFTVLFVVIAMTFMATLDSSIINVALPVLASLPNTAAHSYLQRPADLGWLFHRFPCALWDAF